MKQHSVLLATASLLSSLAGFAQTPNGPTSDEVIALEKFAVTANRTLQPLADIPQRVELIAGDVLAETQTNTISDLLKKNASVDVIQYPSGLSGVGLRGFRPDYSGVSQHVLVLVDGHPTGATGLGSMSALNVERIEVLKGPASSLYGSSAMGGVINIITKKSSGPLSGFAQAGYGSFGTYEGLISMGGGNPDQLDFDTAFRTYTRTDDYRMGNGADWTNTRFENYSGTLRLGRNLGEHWRLDLDTAAFLSRDVENPGGLTYGDTNWSYADWDQWSANLRLTGKLGDHTPQLTLHRSLERYKNYEQPEDAPAFLYYIRDTNWAGLSVQDSWQIVPAFQAIGGFDYQLIKQDYLSYSTTGSGARVAPSSPNDSQDVYGVFLETVTKLFDDRLIFNAGARYDEIELETRPTPYATTLTPRSSSFDTFNPRAGIVYRVTHDLRLHSTIGSAFIAPTSSQTAGYYDKVVGKQRQVTRGNLGLKPESSDTWDVGIGYDRSWLAVDLTYFHTTVDDKIESVYLTNTPAYRESTYVNASTALQTGVEAQLDLDFSSLVAADSGTWLLNFSATKMIDREQTLAAGTSVIRNVADFKFNTGLTWHHGPWRARISARYVRGMWDNDYSPTLAYTNGKGGIFEYPSFIVCDAFVSRKFGTRHEVSLSVQNLFDRFYYEKNDYPMPGLSFFGRYRFSF